MAALAYVSAIDITPVLSVKEPSMSRSMKSVTVFITPLPSKKLDISIHRPRCLFLGPPLRVSQKSLMGMLSKVKRLVDAVQMRGQPRRKR